MRRVDKFYDSQLASSLAKIIDLNGIGSNLAIGAVYSNVAPSAKGFAVADVDEDEDTITEAAHGYVTGIKGQFTTTDTLPDGLDLLTDYWLIKVDANTYKVASSLANAEAGTAVDITDGGAGTHTFTPTTSAGNVLKLQMSVNGSDFEDISGATVTIATSAGVKVWNIIDANYRYVRALYTPSAGQINLKLEMSYDQGMK